jgi:hypothetical protein
MQIAKQDGCRGRSPFRSEQNEYRNSTDRNRSSSSTVLVPGMSRPTQRGDDDRMNPQPFASVENTPLSTDEQLLPFLTDLLEGASRRQVWVTLLDARHCPLPVLLPTDVASESDPDDVVGFADFVRCLAYEVRGSTLVTIFERPGPIGIVDRDRRWLRLLREACIDAGVPFRGPYLLIGDHVSAVPLDEYLGIPWVYFDHDHELESDDHQGLR